MRYAFNVPRRAVSTANAIIIAALVLAVLLLARDAVKLVLKGDKKAATSAVPAERSRPAREPLMHYAPVLDNNVFGFNAGKLHPIKGASEKAGPSAAQATGADVDLVGTVAWPGGFGYAMVAGKSGNQEVYKTGEYIEGSGKLEKVLPDRIVLDAAGKKVEIMMPEVASIKEMPPEKRTAKSAQPRERVTNGFAKKTAENSYVLNRKAIDESLDNPRNILTDARLLPHMVGGQQEGFVIKEVKPGGIFQSLGLENDDVLLSVNGFKLSNPESSLQAFTALKGMERVELEVLRNENPMTLTYEIR